MILIFSVSLSLSAKGQVLFEEVGTSLGIDHMHQFAAEIGGGVACFDLNNDGWEDIYLTGGEDSDKLFVNNGDGSFQDISVSSGISQISNVITTGVVTGDIDNDGFRDILVTTFFGSEVILFHNNGDGTFTKLPDAAISDTPNWTTAATFGDYDLDGLLDVYVTSYVYSSEFITDPSGNIIGYNHDCDPNHLYRNNGDLTFTDVTIIYGVGDDGCGLSTAFTNFDNDDDMDIILVNDFGEWVVPSKVYRNILSSELFVEVSAAVNMNHEMYGMGVAIGDYDRDSDLDYYFTNIGSNVLDRNLGGVFDDQAEQAGVDNDSVNGFNATSWGCFFFDCDNDAWPDLFVGNGKIESAGFNETASNDPNKLFLNNFDGTFTDISTAAGVDGTRRARGVANADFDNDGRMDIIVNNTHKHADSTQAELYHNLTVSSNNWLKFKLTGTQSNKDAFGSHVRLVVDGVSTLMEVDGGSSHASQNTSVLHFGLGTSSIADSVIVTFPSGVEEVLVDIGANQMIEITESSVPVKVSEHEAFYGVFNLRMTNGVVVFETDLESDAQVSLIVHDLSGRLISTMQGMVVSNGLNEMELSNSLADGLYIVSIHLGAHEDTEVFNFVVHNSNL